MLTIISRIYTQIHVGSLSSTYNHVNHLNVMQ